MVPYIVAWGVEVDSHFEDLVVNDQAWNRNATSAVAASINDSTPPVAGIPRMAYFVPPINIHAMCAPLPFQNKSVWRLHTIIQYFIKCITAKFGPTLTNGRHTSPVSGMRRCSLENSMEHLQRLTHIVSSTPSGNSREIWETVPPSEPTC